MISVLVVDDSVVVRRVIVDALEAEPDIRVVGTAANGRIALTKIAQLNPDIVILDIEMPELDGLGTLRELRKTNRTLPVIMFSTLSVAGATATLDALSAGASDFVTKPSNTGSFGEAQRMIREQLVPKIHSLTGHPLRRPGFAPLSPPVRPRPLAPVPPRTGRIAALAIAASTGGPDALSKVIGRLPANLPVPVLIVQHMPPVFTKMFAERLDRSSAIKVVEATDSVPVQPGVVYLAPGDYHLTVVSRPGGVVVTRLNQGPPENSCRPAADVLFRSVADVYGATTLAVVLTGMGQDGMRGADRLHQAGAEVIAQDQASSVVWGMPGAVVGAGLADTVLPLEEIGAFLTTRLATQPVARPKVVLS